MSNQLSGSVASCIDWMRDVVITQIGPKSMKGHTIPYGVRSNGIEPPTVSHTINTMKNLTINAQTPPIVAIESPHIAARSRHAKLHSLRIPRGSLVEWLAIRESMALPQELAIS